MTKVKVLKKVGFTTETAIYTLRVKQIASD